jgi:hypothetical protein
MSGYQDSNLGPPGPKPGALAGLRYTPKNTTSMIERILLNSAIGTNLLTKMVQKAGHCCG